MLNEEGGNVLKFNSRLVWSRLLTSFLTLSLLEIIATGTQMKRTVTLNNITNSSGFEHC